MNKKLSIVVILGCSFILVNMSLAGIPSILIGRDEGNYSVSDQIIKISDSKQSINVDDGDTFITEEFSIDKEIWKSGTKQQHANAGGPYSGDINELIEFDSSYSYVHLNRDVSYEWDFGDGNLGYGEKPTHFYSNPGVYYLTLTITDSEGISYQDIAPVYIDQEANHLIAYGGCYYSADVNEEILFDGTHSFSKNPNHDICKWVWHFGDGVTKQGKKVTHSYSEEKVYLVTLEIEDTNGCKRLDVLHADIGASYSNIKDFFLTTNTNLQSVIDILLNKIGSFILYPLLFVKIYSNYNGYEQTIPLSNGYILPLSIDVNHDGDEDVVVNEINFFKPVISNSPFNNIPWFAFESTISDIQVISDDIKEEDDFTICLQFSLQAIEEFLDLKEPVIRIGYHSSAGEEKPQDFTATHIFRPYILLRLLESSNNNLDTAQTTSNQIQQAECETQNHQTIQTTSLASEKISSNKFSEPVVSDSLEDNDELDQENCQTKKVPANGLDTTPENGLKVESSDVSNISLVISFSNVLNTVGTDFRLTFESFTSTTLTHRRGETLSDVDFTGDDQSSLTISVTRTNQQGSATIGVLINPIQHFGFSIDLSKLSDGGRHIAFNLNNPPENIALFAEIEDLKQDSDSLFFYLRHLPISIEFEWLPRLSDGYISFTKEFDDDQLVVGVCDNLEEPYVNLFMSDIPSETSINWEISSDLPRTIAFSSDTEGLTLNVELKDVTQQNQIVDFQATSNEELDIKLLWSIQDGYFELQRSTKNIDFDFLLSQENLELKVNGNYQGGPDEGFTLKFNDLIDGYLEVQSDKNLNLTIAAENFDRDTTINTDLEFVTSGNMILHWNELIGANFSGTASIGLYDFLITSQDGQIGAGSIVFEEDSNFGFQIGYNTQLQIGGSGAISFSQFEGDVGNWINSIDSLFLDGSYDIKIKPLSKYFDFDSSQSITVSGFNIEHNGPGDENDVVLEIDSLFMHSGGNSWFDFSSTPSFNFDSEDYIDLSDFHLAVGSGGSSAIDFTISEAHVDKKGTIYGEWNDQYLNLDAAVDFNWNLAISTLNFGDWETNGEIEGSVNIISQWDGKTGNITFDVGESGLSHDFEIIHDDLILNLGTMDLEPGDITFEWQREDNPVNGYFNIINNGLTGDLTLFKLTHDDSSDPFVLEFGTITLSSGNLFMEWSRQTDDKFIHVDNDISLDFDLIKISWDEKSVSLEDLILSPGEFRFYWNYADKIATINNGIDGLGPSLSYEDEDQKISVSCLNLQDDYSKTMTLKWYEDDVDNVSGVYLDTDGENLLDWIEFSYIKHNFGGDTGRKIAIGGLQADDFTIVKNDEGNIEVSGKIYLANHITYSKLVNNDWKDLDIQWDVNFDGIGNIGFTADSEFNLGIDISSEFSGVNINTSFDLPNQINISWDIDFDGEGHIGLDTNSEEVYELDFWFYKETAQYQPKWGIYLNCVGVVAEDYVLSWDFTPPPGEWIMHETGYIEPGSLNDMNLAWNGHWYDVLSAGTPI